MLVDFLVPDSSISPRVQPENLEVTKTNLRKEIMFDLAKLLAENQKEMIKLVAPITTKSSENSEDSDSETENISVAQTTDKYDCI